MKSCPDTNPRPGVGPLLNPGEGRCCGRSKRPRPSRGVTLIELLIAVSLLSLLSVGMLMAMRVGLGAMEKSNAKLMSNRRSVSTQRILRSQIENFIPAAADCSAGGDQPPVRVAFFEGRPATMRFVSNYSLQEAGRGYPRILEFQVIPGDNGRGVRLIVNEFLHTGPLSTGAACTGVVPDPEFGVTLPLFRPVQSGPFSFVLADRLAYCRFAYRTPGPSPPPRWVPEWRLPAWPTAIRVDMGPLEPDPSRVPLLPVIAPIRVNRPFQTGYAD